MISPNRIAGEVVAAIVIRNLAPETHRALREQAVRHGRSTEAEARKILDDAVRPAKRVKLGSALAQLMRECGGVDLDISRDKTPAEPIDLAIDLE
jgi:plasmid stability protein